MVQLLEGEGGGAHVCASTCSYVSGVCAFGFLCKWCHCHPERHGMSHKTLVIVTHCAISKMQSRSLSPARSSALLQTTLTQHCFSRAGGVPTLLSLSAHQPCVPTTPHMPCDPFGTGKEINAEQVTSWTPDTCDKNSLHIS